MTPLRNAVAAILLLVLSAVPTLAADASGAWTASWNTPMGVQNYTYTLKVEGAKLTGTAKSDNGETPLTDGKVEGDKITFVESLSFGGGAISINYTGIVNGDEIKFTRAIGDFGTDEAVAKRVKK